MGGYKYVGDWNIAKIFDDGKNEEKDGKFDNIPTIYAQVSALYQASDKEYGDFILDAVTMVIPRNEWDDHFRTIISQKMGQKGVRTLLFPCKDEQALKHCLSLLLLAQETAAPTDAITLLRIGKSKPIKQWKADRDDAIAYRDMIRAKYHKKKPKFGKFKKEMATDHVKADYSAAAAPKWSKVRGRGGHGGGKGKNHKKGRDGGR